jgi:Arc/MetJ family transcription regulator
MKRTTLEIDPELLDRARRALGTTTMRETVDLALRKAAEEGEAEHSARAREQLDALRRLADHIDLDVLGSDEMWR